MTDKLEVVEAVARLGKFLCHRESCSGNKDAYPWAWRDGDAAKCDCGLATALAALPRVPEPDLNLIAALKRIAAMKKCRAMQPAKAVGGLPVLPPAAVQSLHEFGCPYCTARSAVRAARAGAEAPPEEAACQRVVMQSADDSAAYLSVPCTCGKCPAARVSPPEARNENL
jgi:hypothetical protein